MQGWAGDSGDNMHGNDLLSSPAVCVSACVIAQIYLGLYLITVHWSQSINFWTGPADL